MIVIRIELWPGGLRNKAEELGRVVIANDGTGTKEKGNYLVALSHACRYRGRPGAWRSGKLTGFNRKSQSPFHLLMLCLGAVLLGKESIGAEGDAMVEMTREGHRTPGENQIEQLFKET